MADEKELITLREQMDAFKIYIPYVEQYGITTTLIETLIKKHQPIKEQLQYMRARYEASKEGVPILDRQISTSSGAIDTLINNKLNNAFDTDIVDGKVGYFLGHAINYAVHTKVRNSATALLDAIESMRTRDNLADKDMTLGKRASIGGYGARMCYIALENDKPVPRITNVKSDECVFLYRESMAEPSYAMHYYDTQRVLQDGSEEKVTIAEFYDDLYFYRFENIGGSGFALQESKLHGFNYVPLFGMENNDELTAEVQKIINLVNAYDRTMSDVSNEIESTRLAILLLYNLGLEKEDIEKMKATGALEMWGGGDGQGTIDARYLTKDVNDSMIENHLNRIENNIMRFAKSVDFTDEKFASNLSGVAIAFKTMSLEHKAINSENKMRAALQYQMKVLCSAWAKLGICKPDDYLNVWFGFKRNLPQNIKEAAESTVLLKGNVSERTRLSLLPFVDDVEAELQAMMNDVKEFGDLLQPLQDNPLDDPIDDDYEDDTGDDVEADEPIVKENET